MKAVMFLLVYFSIIFITSCTKSNLTTQGPHAVASVSLTYITRPGFILIGNKSTETGGLIKSVLWEQYFPRLEFTQKLGSTLDVKTDFITAQQSFTYYFRLTITDDHGKSSSSTTSIHIP
jgi:hypothetical protein